MSDPQQHPDTAEGMCDADYRRLFQASPFVRLVLAVCDDGRYAYTDVNAAAGQYFGLDPAAMLGKTPREVFDAASADHIEQTLTACVRAKRALTFNALPRMPGGIKVQAFILNPVTDDDGRVRYIDIMSRPDVADGAQLQRERDDAIVLLTSLFDASGTGIIVTDHHGRIVRVNDSFLNDYQWQREDLLGEDFSRIIPQEEQEISRKLYAAFIQRGRHGTREIEIVRKDGTKADVVITTALMELSQKRRFMVTTIRDVTERKNMMRNLLRARDDADSANRAKSSFLANMSHELRTPLNAIIGFSEMIKGHTFGPVNNPKYEEYIADIHHSARYLLDIINDVLDMSKIEAGKIQLADQNVDIRDVMDSVVRIMRDRAAAAGVTVDIDIADGLPLLRADPRLLRQILVNLLANAVKFSQAGKTVKVRAYESKNKGFAIDVVDEGCGIPESKIGHVLEPFGQVNDARHGKGQGTGLGLPLAKAMVELHDGHLSLDSKENYGTRVSISFPAARMAQGKTA